MQARELALGAAPVAATSIRSGGRRSLEENHDDA